LLIIIEPLRNCGSLAGRAGPWQSVLR